MRNLKRVLSLALASVMLLGMMVVGAGAASKDFTDASEIKNVEAVDVMVALGVLEGGDKGDFQPNSILTREQAAKIICYLLLGSDSAEKLTTNYSIFSDVPANRWSAPFISYCVNLGILAGDGAGHFYPEGKLTGVAFAKMLMVCLGYSAEREHYVGNNWEINTSAAAIAAGVAPKALDLSKELSRQDAAQMAFNTLTATMVEYLNDNTIIIGGETIVSTVGKASAVRQGVYDDNMRADYLQFAEKYFPYLILTQGMTDVFGRPAHIWTYKNKDIGTYTDNDLLVAEYTDSVKGKEAYTDIGYSAIAQYDLSVYVDGAESKAITKAHLSKNNNEKLANTGRGVLTQVYVDHETKEISIVIINTYLAEATADYSTKNETLPVVVYYGANNTPATLQTATKKLAVEDFANVAEMTEGTMVKVTMAAPNHEAGHSYNDYTVQSIENAEVVTDVVINSYTIDDDDTSDTKTYRLDTLTADGTKYSTAYKAFYDAEILYNYNDDRQQLKNCKYELYMDDYGNVLGIEQIVAADNYVFVVGYEVGSTVLAQAIDQALIITTDGEMKTVKVTDDDMKVWSDGSDKWVDLPAYTTSSAAVNLWFTYTVKNDGTYNLEKVVKNQAKTTKYTDGNTVSVSGLYADLPTTYKWETTGEPATAYGNADSVYIAVDAKARPEKGYVHADGSIVSVNGVTTGIKNTNLVVENVSGMANFAESGRTYDTFFMYNSKGYVTHAIVVGEDKTSSDNMVFFASGATGRYYDATLDTYYVTYDAIVGGELTTVKVLDDEATSENPVVGSLYEATFDKNGNIKELGSVKRDTGTGAGENGVPMNTTNNKAQGYAQATQNTTPYVTLTLRGATLWIDTETINDKYVVIDDACRVYVKAAKDSDYEEYDTIEGALAALANDTTVGHVTQVTAVCDTTTGYATTLIITETKVGSTPITGKYIISNVATPSVSITGGVVNTAGNSIYGSTNDTVGAPGNAVLTNVVVSYEISIWNTSTGTWNAPTTVKSAAQTSVAAGTYIDAGTNAQAAFGVPASTYCKVVMTVSSNEDVTTFGPVYVSAT